MAERDGDHSPPRRDLLRDMAWGAVAVAAVLAGVTISVFAIAAVAQGSTETRRTVAAAVGGLVVGFTAASWLASAGRRDAEAEADDTRRTAMRLVSQSMHERDEAIRAAEHATRRLSWVSQRRAEEQS